MARRSWHRRSAALLLAAAAGVVLARLMLLQGWWSVVRIDGGSMAPSLPGESVELTCSRCTQSWLVDRLQGESSSYVPCTNCRQAADRLTGAERRGGTRVVIDRAAYLLERPQRFDVVAFRAGDRPRELAVKRIVGLPGETWEIRGGELYADGRLVRKTFRQFREMAVLVAEQRPQAISGWKPLAATTAWNLDDTLLHWRSAADAPPDWLAFQHFAAYPTANPSPSPVQDYDAYNPALSRELNDVTDLLAEGWFSCSPGLVWELKMHDGYEEYRLVCDAASGHVALRRGEHDLARASGVLSDRPGQRLAWGVCDRQLFVAVDGRLVVREQLEARSDPPQPSAAPLAIGVQGIGTAEIRDLKVWRDVY